MLNVVQPNLTIVEVTVKEVYEAIKKNGFEHIRKQWFDESNYGAACILGQGALNLGVLASYDTFYIHEDPNGFGGPVGIYGLAQKHALDKQLNQWMVPRDSKWADNGINRLGDTIVRWNDLVETDEEGESLYDEHGDYIFVLKTYEDVTNMAYDLLSPHFDEKLQLIAFDYNNPPKASEMGDDSDDTDD